MGGRHHGPRLRIFHALVQPFLLHHALLLWHRLLLLLLMMVMLLLLMLVMLLVLQLGKLHHVLSRHVQVVGLRMLRVPGRLT